LNIFHRCYFQLRFLTNKGTWGFSSEQPTCVGGSTLRRKVFHWMAGCRED
jgi:hypothetical protein